MSARLSSPEEMMGEPVLSPSAITAIAGVITGGPGTGSTEKQYGVYRTGTELEAFFANCDVDFSVGSESRVPAVRHLLTRINRRRDGMMLLKRVIEAAVDPAPYRTPAKQREAVEYLNARLKSGELQVTEVGGQWRLVTLPGHAAVTEAVQRQAEALDYDSVQHDLERALTAAESDPEDAITAACSALESVCRCILEEMNQALPAKKDISHLVAAVQKHLNLSPARTDIAPEVKQILGGLSNVANGIGALRTHAGDAHGRGKGTVRVDSRIARLAVHAASTAALFLIETWRERDSGAEPS